MLGLAALILRSDALLGWPTLFACAAVASAGLTLLYRILGSGLAPPMDERIGVAGWLAAGLTVAVPLIVVGAVALLSRTLIASRGLQIVATAAAGLVALWLFPAYGALIYCGFTRVCL